ncbi:unnamed protein product, partial [Porites lobata]
CFPGSNCREPYLIINGPGLLLQNNEHCCCEVKGEARDRNGNYGANVIKSRESSSMQKKRFLKQL